MKYFVANLKMYLTLKETLSLVKKVRKSLQFLDKKLANIKIVICPSFTAIEEVGKFIKGASTKSRRHLGGPASMPAKLALGGQDVFWAEIGAYTGEISAQMLKRLGARFVIIGHSERRALGERDRVINKKVKAALRAMLYPILCVGENLDQRKRGSQNLKVARQLSLDLAGIRKKELSGVIIAYEPIWAIGTGHECDPEEAEAMVCFIKQKLPGIRVLYGGSVDHENISSFFKKRSIDGVLVGGASTEPQEFIKMIKEIIKAK